MSISKDFENAINEVLKGDQHKIDKNKNGKLDKEDFKLLRKEEHADIEQDKKLIKKMKDKDCKEETAVEEGWDDMLKAVKEKQKPQPNGGSGKKQGTAYGGSKQKDTKEPVKEESTLSPEEAARIAQIAKELGLQ